MQATTVMARVKAFFTKKSVIWSAVILVIIIGIIYLIFGRSKSNVNIQTDIVKRQDIQKTVLTTGEVVSSVDLALSFQASGVVSKLNVKEGDGVKSGTVLATLDQGAALASLQSAEGSLAQAEANYKKVSAAATAQDIAVSQAAVDSASTALSNAKQSLAQEISLAYSNANSTIVSNINDLFDNPLSNSPQFDIPGTSQNNQQLYINVNNEKVTTGTLLSAWQTEILALSDSTTDQTVTDSLAKLTSIRNFISDILSMIGYSQASTASGQAALSSAQAEVVAAKTTIDNTITTLTNDSQAVRNAKASLSQTQAALALKQAPARPEDIATAQAQVISAQGQVDTAQVILNNTIIRAPADGTITQVDTKLGEQAQVGAEVMKLQNVGDLHAEADVSEADIVSVVVAQPIDYTFDALGPDQHFSGAVLTVNPSSIVISGVVDYKVTGSFDNVPGIKPGMTANMTILVASKKGVLTVPSTAVISQNNKNYVRVIDNPKTKTYHQVEVTTGLQADGGLTEILSGLSDGQQVVTFIN